MKRSKNSFDLIEAIRSYFRIQPFKDIVQWVNESINLSDDVSSQRDKPDFEQYPYQLEILKHWEDMQCRKRVVVVAGEQYSLINNG